MKTASKYMALALALVVILVGLVLTTPETEPLPTPAKEVIYLQKKGYSNIQLEESDGWGYYPCEEGITPTYFTAYRDGKHTEGVVCCTVLFPCYEVK
jgi:hypothetical protein